MTVYGFDGKKKETLKAKIDTGADSTSIDIKVLERLGYGDILSRYNELIKSELQEISIEKLNREECSQLADRLTETARSQIPEIYKVGSIVSSHGKSLRPFLNIKLSIAGSVIDSHSSAYDRSDLTYAVIIGRNNLKQFLIDPSKK